MTDVGIIYAGIMLTFALMLDSDGLTHNSRDIFPLPL